MWVTCDMDALAHVIHVKPSAGWWEQISEGIQAKRRDMKYRHSKLLRAHTHVNICQLEEDPDGSVRVQAEEHITWVCRDGQDFGVESRVILHHQRWSRRGNLWCLAMAWESHELQSRMPGQTRQTQIEATGELFAPQHDKSYKNCATYDRVRALRYAELWWNGSNPAFPKLADDCTNFISQCLWAGNMPMREGASRASGWWIHGGHPRTGENKTGENWSYSWTTAQALFLYLMHKLNASQLQNPRELKIGDLVFYDWGGTGRHHHSSIVVDFDNQGDPLVNAHTDSSERRHYLYLDSRAWTPRTKYAYVHVPEVIC